MAEEATRDAAMGALIRRFPSFLGVGAIGFLIDAAVFFGLTGLFSVRYGWARVVASIIALTATWLMNRTRTFSDGRVYSAPVEFLRYLAASAAGAGSNLAALSLVAPHDAALHHVPAYIIGAAVGLVVNFFLYDRFVFHGRSKPGALRPLPTETPK
jgi:putative flippase GtrA